MELPSVREGGEKDHDHGNGNGDAEAEARTEAETNSKLDRIPPSSSTHRMPTVSAAQALDELDEDLREGGASLPSSSSSSPTGKKRARGRRKYRRWISTGIEGLDLALLGVGKGMWEELGDAAGEGGGDDVGAQGERGNDEVERERLASGLGVRTGGVERGKVTEVYGPPGVGKTAFGIQLAAHVLKAGYKAIWIDAAHTLPGPRLEQVLTSPPSLQDEEQPERTDDQTPVDLLSNLLHFTTPTLPHLIALLHHTSPTFPPSDTALLVIDSLSTLVTTTYPRGFDNPATSGKPSTAVPKHESHQWATSRKWSVLQYLISSFQKLAALHNIAVVVLNQTATKMHPGSSAVLVPSISSTAWDAGISARIVLFRDWAFKGREVRLAGVVKGDGGSAQRLVGHVGKGHEKKNLVAFCVQAKGLRQIPLPDRTSFPHSRNQPISPRQQHRLRKRKADEIQDSEDENEDDEDYGWAEDDEEHLPALPPQWQGSEDLLVLPEKDIEDENDEEEGGDDEGDEWLERRKGQREREGQRELWSDSSAAMLDSEAYYWAAGDGGSAGEGGDENEHRGGDEKAGYEVDDGYV